MTNLRILSLDAWRQIWIHVNAVGFELFWSLIQQINISHIYIFKNIQFSITFFINHSELFWRWINKKNIIILEWTGNIYIYLPLQSTIILTAQPVWCNLPFSLGSAGPGLCSLSLYLAHFHWLSWSITLDYLWLSLKHARRPYTPMDWLIR